MARFSKRNKNKPLRARQEKLAGYVAAAIIRRQALVAVYLNRRTQYWNRASKITALIIFCLVFGGASIYLLLKAIL